MRCQKWSGNHTKKKGLELKSAKSALGLEFRALHFRVTPYPKTQKDSLYSLDVLSTPIY